MALAKPIMVQNLAKKQSAFQATPTLDKPKSMGVQANFPGLLPDLAKNKLPSGLAKPPTTNANVQSSQTALKPGQFGAGAFATITPSSSQPSAYVQPNPQTTTPAPQVASTAPKPTPSPVQQPAPIQQPTYSWQTPMQQTATLQQATPQPNAMYQGQAPYSQQYQIPQQNQYAGLIQQLVNQAQMTPEEQALRQQSAQLKEQLALQMGQQLNRAIPLEFQTGRIQTLQNMAAQRETALQSGIQSYAAQRGVSEKAFSDAANFYKPTTLSGGQYLMSPTGQEMGNGFMGGLDRQRQYDNFMFNTGQSQDFAGQAAQLQQPMQALHLLGSQVSQFVEANGLNNQTSPMANAAINTYLSQANPAAYQTLVAAGAEAKNLIARIAGAGGDLIPTELTAMAQSMSVENMTARDLVLFIQSVDALGQARLFTLQQSAQASGSSTTQPYSGQPANPQTTLPQTPMPANLMGNVPTTNDPLKQGVMGAGLGLGTSLTAGVGAVVGYFTRLFGKGK